jgi:hypothetical protein
VTAPTDAQPTRRSAEVDDRPRGSRRGSSRWWRFGFPVSLAALVLAIPVLVWTGAQVVLGSSEGRVVRSITDPEAPGWEAIVDPTPVLVLASVDEADVLDSLTLLSLTGEGTGAVVQLPATTLIEVPGIGSIPLNVVYADKGLEGLRNSTESLLGVGIPDIDVIEPEEWVALVRPVSPLTISNPDPVMAPDGSGTVLFSQASIDVPASDIWTYLSARNPNESDLARMVRVEAFWRAWLAQVGADPDGPRTVPGEIDSGVGRFVRTLARDRADVTTLPVEGEPIDDETDAVFRPLDDYRDLIARVVPFPAGPEGLRPRVAVFDGTGELGHGIAAAMRLAAGGGQIDKVGNAPTFDVATTRFIYYQPTARPRVEALRAVLGVGELVASDELNSAVDVTVVLGADYVGQEPSPEGAGG